jgi:NADP-dependent 3-hydroxy acid dehydrogenase YdfG
MTLQKFRKQNFSDALKPTSPARASSEGLRLQTKDIRVTIISPGVVESELFVGGVFEPLEPLF